MSAAYSRMVRSLENFPEPATFRMALRAHSSPSAYNAHSRYEPGIFEPLRDMLLTHGDHYMHLADLGSYLDAHEQLGALYATPNAWARKAILNIAGSGKFSSDRTIAQYAGDIWKVEPCMVP